MTLPSSRAHNRDSRIPRLDSVCPVPPTVAFDPLKYLSLYIYYLPTYSSFYPFLSFPETYWKSKSILYLPILVKYSAFFNLKSFKVWIMSGQLQKSWFSTLSRFFHLLSHTGPYIFLKFLFLRTSNFSSSVTWLISK